MFRIKTLLLIFIFCFCESSISGDRVGNGGGRGEQNFSFALLNLGKTIEFCLASNDCLSTQQEYEVLNKIYYSLNEELNNPQQLIFLSGHKHPEIFMINGSIRTAVTGDKVGDTIYINTDLIYTKSYRSNIIMPITIPSAMGILIHELGHHHGVKDHAFLDLIGAKVKSIAYREHDIIAADNFNGGIEIRSPEWVFNAIHSYSNGSTHLTGAETSIILVDEWASQDLTSYMTKALRTCPQTKQSPATKMIGYRLYNFRRGPWYIRERATSLRTYSIIAQALLYCEYDDYNMPVRYESGFDVKIELPIDYTYKRSGWSGWALNRNLLKIHLLPIR